MEAVLALGQLGGNFGLEKPLFGVELAAAWLLVDRAWEFSSGLRFEMEDLRRLDQEIAPSRHSMLQLDPELQRVRVCPAKHHFRSISEHEKRIRTHKSPRLFHEREHFSVGARKGDC